MLHALKTEITYFKPWLLGGLGIAAFVSLLLSVLIRFFEEGEGPPVFLLAMFPAIAGMVVSFVAQGYRIDEHRARLLLAGPLTPRQLAGVTVLLPSCLFGLCAIAAIPIVGLAFLITNNFEHTSLYQASGFTLQFFAYAQLGPLAQESTAARRQRRSRAALAGWAVFVGAILVLAASQFFFHTIQAQMGIVVVVLTTMGVAAVLYRGRTDFTR